MLADSITALWNLQLICSIDFGEAIAFPVASPRPKQKHWNPVLPTWVRASFSLPVGHQKHCLPRAAASALFSLSRRSCTWSPFPQLAAARWLRCVAHQSPLQRGHATWHGHSDGLPGVRFWGQDAVNNQNGGSMWVLCCLGQWLVSTILGACLHLYCLLVLQIWRHSSETCELWNLRGPAQFLRRPVLFTPLSALRHRNTAAFPMHSLRCCDKTSMP